MTRWTGVVGTRHGGREKRSVSRVLRVRIGKGYQGQHGKLTRATLEAEALLPCAQGAEVLGGLGNDVSPEIHDDAPRRGVADGDVEVNLWVGHGELRVGK